MASAGYYTKTLVSYYYNIHNKDDFDIYYYDLIPEMLRFSEKLNSHVFGPLFSFLYVVKHVNILNISFLGGYLGGTSLWFFESFLYQLAKIKVVVAAYGGDFYLYSKVIDTSLRNALLMSYPTPGKEENLIRRKVDYWSRNADIIVNGLQLDGLGRWSCLPVSAVSLDQDKIIDNRSYCRSSDVTIVHAPNHRGFKGTEFIINAVDELRKEGYRINFILIENMKNSEVLKILREADILVEQLITGYGLNAIEGMASGAAVLSNVSNDYYKVLRRYSYLNECPILSTTPESIKDNLILLIKNSQLREELGRLGIAYVKKYHSEAASRYMYGKIFNHLVHGEDEDLMNMFHPIKSDYNMRNYIQTPLVDNCYVG